MQHLFEFIVTRKQSEEDKAQEKEQEVLNLMYKTESNRKEKVHKKILKELGQKDIIQTHEIEDFYLRQIR